MPFFFRHKRPPAPDPFDPSRWLERCCERLRRDAYAKPLPNGGTCDLGLLTRLFRAVRSEHFVRE